MVLRVVLVMEGCDKGWGYMKKRLLVVVEAAVFFLVVRGGCVEIRDIKKR